MTDILTPNEVRSRLGLPALQHIAVSDKPWSDYKESDYSIEQWHAACLMHLHDGPPTSKNQCKLPVRTPNGTLNSNGVHAAAAALAGARGGVQAPPDKKKAAARVLVSLYGKLDEQAPPSLGSMMQSSIDRVTDFLAHAVASEKGGGGGKFDESKVKRDGRGQFSKQAVNSALDGQWLSTDPDDLMDKLVDELGNAKMNKLFAAAMGVKWDDITDKMWQDPEFEKKAAATMVDVMNERIPQSRIGVSPSGTKRLELHIESVGKYSDVKARVVPYNGPNPHQAKTRQLRTDYKISTNAAITNRKFTDLLKKVRPRTHFRFNPNAQLDPSRVHDISDPAPLLPHRVYGVTHSESVVDNFLKHFGIRGMHWGVRRSRGPGGTVSSGVGKPHSGEPDEIVAIKTKLHESGFNSLTNNEMNTLVNRMNLQTNYAKMTSQPSKLKRGKDFVDRQLTVAKTANELIKFANSPAGHLIAGALRPKGAGRHLAGKHQTGMPFKR